MTEYEALKRQDELIKNNSSISNYDLVTYQRKMSKEYPYYPIKPEDWDKLNELTISVKGLEQLQILKRQTIMGNSNPEDIELLITLLDLYALANPKDERIRDWKKNLDFHFNTLWKTNYFPDLVKEGLVVKNEKYDPKFKKLWNEWRDNLIQRCYQLAEKEGKIF